MICDFLACVNTWYSLWVAHYQGLNKGKAQVMIFWRKFSPFCEKYFEKECSIKIFTFKRKTLENNQITTKKFTIACSI
jgi:hypothetical protein